MFGAPAAKPETKPAAAGGIFGSKPADPAKEEEKKGEVKPAGGIFGGGSASTTAPAFGAKPKEESKDAAKPAMSLVAPGGEVNQP
jgi:hypothetical protein